MMLYTQYLDGPVDSPHLRHFTALYGRGNVPTAKFRFSYFDEQPVYEPPAECAENTTLELGVLDDRYNSILKDFVLTRLSNEPVHHVHLKFNGEADPAYDFSRVLPEYPNLLVQLNAGKLPRKRTIVTVFHPKDAFELIHKARRMQGYAGAVADKMLVDRL